MAVQAQYYPPGSLQDIPPKNGQEAGAGALLLPPFSYPVFTIAGCELVAEEDPQLRAVPPLAVAGGRKRSRQMLPFLSREDGSLEDERLASSATAGAPNHHHHNQSMASLFQDLSNQTLQQHHEFHNFMLNQMKRFCHCLEEKRQRHSLALLTIAEETFHRELKLREEEMGKLLQGSQDLEDRAKHLRVEIHAWQSKAKSSEAMAIALHNALQKAMAHNKEQSKFVEGSGDSELDDAESVAHVDVRPHYTKTNLGIQCCKRCRSAEATILVLPCRHLCCCKDCESSIESCPLCHSSKTASVEVYLS